MVSVCYPLRVWCLCVTRFGAVCWCNLVVGVVVASRMLAWRNPKAILFKHSILNTIEVNFPIGVVGLVGVYVSA